MKVCAVAFADESSPETITEELKASQVGEGLFVVESVPFVDTSVALGDIVECKKVDSHWHINRVVSRGGNATWRIHAPGVDVVTPLLNMDVHVEVGPGSLCAISLSPDSPTAGIVHWLEELQDQGLIDLAPGYQPGC